MYAGGYAVNTAGSTGRFSCQVKSCPLALALLYVHDRVVASCEYPRGLYARGRASEADGRGVPRCPGRLTPSSRFDCTHAVTL
jgi:hypothetical protein